MDLFKYDSPSLSPFRYGVPIDQATTKRWTERYRGEGEIELKAPVSSGLHLSLPPKTFVGNVDSTEVMVIEDHVIEEPEDEDPTVTIFGRTVDALLYQRVVGMELAHSSLAPPATEFLISGSLSTGEQVRYLIEQHILASEVSDANNALPYFAVATYDTFDDADERVIPRGYLRTAVGELLDSYDLGLKTVRLSTGVVNLVIHKGVDRSETVIFSYETGEFVSAEYLRTIRNLKNTAYVKGRYVESLVYTGFSGLDRRVLFVDASDLDDYFTETPSPSEITAIRTLMGTRGYEALSAHRELTISQVEVSSGASAKFRKDYGIGDIVTIDGNYGSSGLRRVTEYTEIEDEEGESGHPTLSVLEE